jgi:hypothetical protein
MHHCAKPNADGAFGNMAAPCRRREQGAEAMPAKIKEGEAMRKLIFLTAGLLVPALLMAQLDRIWVNTYNGPCEVKPEEMAHAMAVDKDGYVYVCGKVFGSVTTILDYITIKYDPTTGEVLWVRFYNNDFANAEDQATAIAVDDAGGVYVTGYSYHHGIHSGYDYTTIKYDAADGTELWVRRYDGPFHWNDFARAIAVDDAGCVYVTGDGGLSFVSDYLTVKYNSSGDLQWAVTYNGPADSNLVAAMAVDNAGGVYVTGSSNGGGHDPDYATVKYCAADGSELWVRRYEGPGDYTDSATAIAVDNAGGVYVSGGSARSSSWFDYATIKYDADGNQQWVACYDGPANRNDVAYAIALDNAGGVYVTGYSRGSGSGLDYATLKYDADGNQQWLARYNSSDDHDDQAFAIAVDNAGRRVYVTGWSGGAGSGYDILTAAYDPETGEEVGVDRYAGSAGLNDLGWATATDAFGCAYVTGYCQNLGTSYDIVTIKYGPIVIDATIDVDPNKLNLQSKGKWVTCYIELPEAFSVNDIDLSTVAISAIDGELLDPPLYREGPTEIGDYDHDGISDLMVKFNRQELVDILRDMGYGDGDRPELTVTGGLVGDTAFEGADTIELINNKGKGQDKATDLPASISILQTSPDPFRLPTSLRYGLPTATHVRLEVYSPTGQRVATLVDRIEGAGYHSATWNGRDDAGRELAAGIYLCRFEAGTYKTTRKTQLLR